MKKLIFYFFILLTVLQSCSKSHSVDPEELKPSKPLLDYPSNNLDKCDVNLTLEWATSIAKDGNAISYELKWGEIGENQQTIRTNETFYELEQLKFNTQFEWQVTAIDSEGNQKESDNYAFKTKAYSDYLYKQTAWHFPEDEDYDICALHTNGEMLAYKIGEGNRIQEILYKKDENSSAVLIEADENGLPAQVVVDDFIFLFSNYNAEENTFDLGVVKDDKQIEILRGLDFDNVDNITISDFINQNQTSRCKSFTFNDAIKWGGYTASAVGCGFSIASAVGTGGLAIPLAALSCTAAVNNIAREFIAEEDTLLYNSSYAYSGAADLIGLSSCFNHDYYSCTASAVAVFSDVYGLFVDEAAETVEAADTEINQVKNILEHGYGTIQVTLSWDNSADVDLWVTDPTNERIYYNHSRSNSGGYLDVDDTNGYGPENIFWEENAPSGTYKVQVDHYSGSAPSNYIVTINAFGNTQTFNGVLNDNETITIANFSNNEIVPLSIIETNTNREKPAKK